MMRRWVLALVVLLAAAGGSARGAEMKGDSLLGPPRSIPGLTAPDEYPRGCVDCHVNRPDLGMDVRLSTLMQTWQAGVKPEFLEKVQAAAPEGVTLKGRHPKVSLANAELPTGCLKCHSKTSKTAPPFSRMLHRIHLTGGEKSVYLTLFKGECTDCHKLDQATGSWSLGHGTE
jgi:hypothetical protein